MFCVLLFLGDEYPAGCAGGQREIYHKSQTSKKLF